MLMYNSIEYSDNYLATSGSLWQFKTNVVLVTNDDLSINNCQSFKYKVVLVGKTADVNKGYSFVKNI